MNKPAKLFKKYQSLMQKDTLTETDIISIKSRISGNPCSLKPCEIDKLEDHFRALNCNYTITSQHAQKGIDYLKEKCLKRNGQPRRTKQVADMPAEFFDAIKDYSHFTFVGFEALQYNPYSNFNQYMPIWRIHTRAGKTFDYCMGLNLNFQEV